MNRAVLPIFALWMISIGLAAQAPSRSPFSLAKMEPGAAPDPIGGAGGGGQAEHSAERGNAFSRLALGATFSTLGIGGQLGTNIGSRLDLRLFGSYDNLTHNFTRSRFRIALNIGMANAGVKLDFYPLRRFPLRITPGYLFFNQNGLAATLHADPGATFTINNVEYASSRADPVHGTGGLSLSGGGFMAMAGLGHVVSRSRRRFTFPFEAGVVFINRPVAQFNLLGQVCSVSGPRFCEPAAQFPTFTANLAAQLASWNRLVAPYHIYPIVEGGVTYTFTFRRRGVE
jgi:hypothetical protein